MARNMTLLFFLERLLDKGEPRTLHDLSCQFGAKGFTKEMRQIAGGSQSGELFEKFSQYRKTLFRNENFNPCPVEVACLDVRKCFIGINLLKNFWCFYKF